MQASQPSVSLARDLRGEFQASLAGVLREAGFPEDACDDQAKRIIHMVEPDSLEPKDLYFLAANANKLRSLVEAAAGRPVHRLVIAPVPGYFEPLIPLFEKQFPEVVLCDNYKIGKSISNCAPVISLDSVLASIDDYDCVLIGTVDQKIRGLFNSQLPPEKTVSVYDVIESVMITSAVSIETAQEIETEIRALKNPFIILCHRFTPPYISILSGLRDAGFDVVVLSRFKDNAGLGPLLTDIRTLGATATYPVNLVENLYLARVLDHCPWWVLNDGFLHASWSFERAAWHYAYTAALLDMISGPRILCLYDPIKPANKDYEFEELTLRTYSAAARHADGIHIGCASQYLVDFTVRATGAQCPSIGFLRYNLPPKGPRPTRRENFSIALVSPIANEVSDPGTDLRNVIQELLRQGLELHYYTGSPDSQKFKDSLPEEESRHLFLHPQIIDQEELIRDISKCQVGWCVANLAVFNEIVSSVKTQEFKDLYSLFPRTTVPSRALAFGAAGLPVIYNSILHEVENIFPDGCAIPFDFSQASFLTQILQQQDWPALWERMEDAAGSFMIASHFDRFLTFLDAAQAYAWQQGRGAEGQRGRGAADCASLLVSAESDSTESLLQTETLVAEL